MTAVRFTLMAAVLLAACDLDKSPQSPSVQASKTADARGHFLSVPDASGEIATLSADGSVDFGNPFFQSLGTNGRSCATCHLQKSGFGLGADAVQEVYASRGLADPLFAAVDGANCASVTPAAGVAGHSLLLGFALVRVALGLPGNADFTVNAVHDPYGCAIQGDPPQVSVYRRVLPSTNLAFLSAVMFDGRETVAPLNNGATHLANLRQDLTHQAMDATLGHAQATAAPSQGQLDAIVRFELALYTAQRTDNAAGGLNAEGANGGPEELTRTEFYPGINDPLGGNPTGAAFDPSNGIGVFKAWGRLKSTDPFSEARKAVGRGEVIFNTRPLLITAVAGLNDALNTPVIPGTCTTCHNTPNLGNHSLPLALDIGVSHDPAHEADAQVLAALAVLTRPELPVYQVSCTRGPFAGTVRYTSDPGRALITGSCSDLGRVKGPILRGLASRAPYFHNGTAANLAQVVEFYNLRFQMHLTAAEKADLLAFLKTL